MIDENLIINTLKAKKDKKGIWVSEINLSGEVEISKKAWDGIYDYTEKQLLADKRSFEESKLEPHMDYINKSYSFRENTVFLEIGCGPAFIGEYLMKTKQIFFVGVDFNYTILMTLKNHFDKSGFKNYLLIHADIENMPIKESSIDYIYGGGVIEHFPDTVNLLKEMRRVIKSSGVMFNTVPALTLTWPIRFYSNIPDLRLVRKLLEFIHLKIFKGKILERFFGFELSFTKKRLVEIHEESGFNVTNITSFAFLPSQDRVRNAFLRKLYFEVLKNPLTAQIWAITATKSEKQ